MSVSNSQFDQVIDRNQQFALKWQKFRDQDVIPMWVADMDFEAPQAIKKALQERISQCDLGYTPAYHDLNQATISWLKEQHDWHVEADWIVWVPGVVPAFNIACQAFVKQNNQCVLQTPNYPPLLNVAEINNKQTVLIDTKLESQRWVLDYKALAGALSNPQADCFIHCNPSNPHGTQLSEQEVQSIAKQCRDNNVVYLSDEIHCDLRLDGKPHFPAAKIDPENAISMMAASKTFNIAGLGCAFLVIPSAKLRQQFLKQAEGIMSWPALLGYTATQAAFSGGHQWHSELIQYLTENRDILCDFINDKTPFSATKNEATFLLWVNGNGFCDDLYQWFIDAGIAPSPGKDFGDKAYIRLNFACPRSTLKQAIERLTQALAE